MKSTAPDFDVSAALVTPRREVANPSRRGSPAIYLLVGVLLLLAWLALYRLLAPAAGWITYSLLSLSRGTHLSSAIEFFVFAVPKVLMLLTLVVFGVGIMRFNTT